MRHLTESINISDFSYISSILVRSIAVSHPASHLIALRELIQSLFLLFLPRLLIFALFSSLISFPTHTHTHKYGRFIFKTTWEAVSFSFLR